MAGDRLAVIGRHVAILTSDWSRLTEYHWAEAGAIGYIEHSRDGVTVKTSYHHNKAGVAFYILHHPIAQHLHNILD